MNLMMLNMNKESIFEILIEELNMRKVCDDDGALKFQRTINKRRVRIFTNVLE